VPCNVNIGIYVTVTQNKLLIMSSVIIAQRWASHVARMAEKRGAYRILVGTPEGRRPLGRTRRRR
jgi:hypothetical protein